MSSNGERLAYLDYLRGLAVLGLLLMNAPFMGLFESEFRYPSHSPALISDTVVNTINTLFFDSRFRSLFCLLFGIGLYLQSLSYRNKDLDFKSIIKTRLKWLFVFGLVHCCFIWPGDILILYSLCGFFILKQLDFPADILLKKGIVYFSIGNLVITVVVAVAATFPDEITRNSEAFLDVYNNAIDQSYWQYVGNNLLLAIFYIITFPFLSLLELCGIMFIGLGLFKSGKLQTGFNHKQIRLLISATVLLSIIDASLVIFMPEVWNRIPNVIASVSGLTMALCIWHFVVTRKLYLSTRFVPTALKRVGQTALSFYILQSIVVTLLLREVYPEWNLTFGLLDYLLLSLLLIAVQLGAAFVYRQHFSQGPLEYIWRYLVQAKINKLTSIKTVEDKNGQL